VHVIDLAPFRFVTMCLLPLVNLQLRERLRALAPGTCIVSHDGDLGDWTPDLSGVADAPDKSIGRVKASTMHLWVVPARLAGWWCGADAGLFVRQHEQWVWVTLLRRGLAAPAAAFDRRATAAGLHDGPSAAAATVVASASGDTLRLTRPAGVAAIGVEGVPLRRSAASCF
jgi:hypothetical protein